MWPNPQVTFTEEILNGKLHFLCSVISYWLYIIYIHSYHILSLLIKTRNSFYVILVSLHKCSISKQTVRILCGSDKLVVTHLPPATWQWFRSSHRRCSGKKVFLEISQNSEENNCTRASFQACNFIKEETLSQVFFCEFWETFKNLF